MNNTIQYVKRTELDEQKWNTLITESVNSLPYAYSWYLDTLATWDAFVLNDFEAVMPLVWMRKFGIRCLYQPYYCQQLGIFSKRTLSRTELQQFMVLVNDAFPYVNINFNPSVSGAISQGHAAGFSNKKNLLLALSGSYAQISGNYSESHRRNIAKAAKKGLQFSEDVTAKVFQKFYLDNVDRTKENFKPKHAAIFKSLTAKLIEGDKGKIFAAIDSEGELMAAVLVITHYSRLIAIINTSSVQGKQSGASPFVFDGIIRKHAGTDKVLDFEGSSIPGIARFYEGFGALEERFYNYRHSILKSLSQRF